MPLVDPPFLNKPKTEEGVDIENADSAFGAESY